MKKIYFSLAIIMIVAIATLTLSGEIFAAQKLITPLVITITQPNKSNPPPIHYTKDPILLPEETFTVKGVAQPNTSADMYVLSMVPGTDGIKEEERAITNFNAEIINDGAADKIRFTWKPRRIFQKEHLMGNTYWKGFGNTNEEIFANFNADADGIPDDLNFDFCTYDNYDDAENVENYQCSPSNTDPGIYEYAPNTCEVLKTNCLVGDEILNDPTDTLRNGQCYMGNTPEEMKCLYDKKPYNVYTIDGQEARKYLVYNKITKPINCSSCSDIYLKKFDIPTEIPPDTTINNTFVKKVKEIIDADPTLTSYEEYLPGVWSYISGNYDLSMKDDLSLDTISDLINGFAPGPNKIEVHLNNHDPNNKTYLFGETTELVTTLENTDSMEKKQINITYEFDTDCLKVFKKPLHTGGCHDTADKKLICSENTLAPGEIKQYKFKMQALNKRCQMTKVNVTVSLETQEQDYSVDDIYSKAYETLQVLEYKQPSMPLLNNDSDKEPIDPVEFYYNNTLLGNTAIEQKSYLPNIRTKNYSGNYIYQYSNINYVGYWQYNTDGSWKWENAFGFFPLKDKIILVDAFDQYEIYAIKKDKYPTNVGIVRDAKYKDDLQLIAIVKDPSAEYVDVKLTNFDPEEYVFAIFEVRESYFTNVPDPIKNAVEDNFYIDIGGTKHKAVWGHLVSAWNELEINLSDPTGTFATQTESPQKYEWEVFEQRKSGYYTSAPPIVDPDGNIDLQIPLKQFNRFADNRFLSGVYYSSDKKLASTSNTFQMVASRDASSFFNLNSLISNDNLISNTSNLHGIVFDTFTGNFISKATIKINGEQEIASGLTQNYDSSLTTSTDGLFEFDINEGKYYLDITKVNDLTDNFIFSCPNPGIYASEYCDPTLEIPIISNNDVTKNIPLKPTAQGKIIDANNRTFEVFVSSASDEEIGSTISNPDGKFSFFLSTGSYKISKIIKDDGEEVPIAAGNSFINFQIAPATVTGFSFKINN